MLSIAFYQLRRKWLLMSGALLGFGTYFVSCLRREAKEDVVQVELRKEPVGGPDQPSLLPHEISYVPVAQKPAIGRDPFVPQFQALQPTELEIGHLRLVGIISGSDGPRALVEDLLGNGFVFGVGSPIGSNGKVDAIRADEMVIRQDGKDDSGKPETGFISLRLGQ